MLEGAYKEYIQ